MKVTSIEEFRAGLDQETLATVDLLRSLVAAAHPELKEHIKWNAPSFVLDGEHRITLGLERRGGVRVVLHRGAKIKDLGNFHFSDPSGLAEWPAPDRGVLVFKDVAQVESCRTSFSDLCARWLLSTR